MHKKQFFIIKSVYNIFALVSKTIKKNPQK